MTEKRIDLSRRQILGGLGTIGAASAAAGLGTEAFLSDTETFENNRIVGGTLDLKVDWEEHYSDWSEDETDGLENELLMEPPQDSESYVGLPDPESPLIFVHEDDLEQFMDNTSIEAFPDTDDDGVQDALENFDACADFADAPDDMGPTEGLRTRNSDTIDENGNTLPLVNVEDVKPGDFGELTLSFHLCDNDGFVWLQGGLNSASENGVSESEADSALEEDGVVELLDSIQTLVWYDEDLDNVLDDGEEVIFRGSIRELLRLSSIDNGIPLDGDRETAFDEIGGSPSADARECFPASSTEAIGLAWWIPTDVGNEIQTDSVSFDLGFYAEQCRHNEGAGQAGVRRSIGSVSQLSTDNVPEPPEPPDEPIKPPEVFLEGIEELKERAETGDVLQPPEETVQTSGVPDAPSPPEGSGLDIQSTSTEEGSTANVSTSDFVDTAAGFPAWENSELSATPPDANLAVGPSKIVAAVNLRWGIYDKFSGNREFEVALDDWWDPVLPDEEDFVFDPKALYDHHSDRFVLIAVSKDRSSDSQGSWVVAVSDDSNPFGLWWITRIPHGVEDEWPDYPGLGVDENGIYLTANIFGRGFERVKLVSIDKTPLYNGNSFTYWWFGDVRRGNGDRAYTLQPTHDMPSTSRGSTQWLVDSRAAGGDELTLFELRNPTSSPRLFAHDISVPQYGVPPNAEQPNTSATLDTVDARLMNAVYENGSVWTAHSINYDWDNDGDASALLRWYEIDTRSKSISQVRGWGRPNGDYFFPTVASDGNGTMITYNESGPETPVRIEVAGRTPDHTPNSLEDVEVIKFGESAAPGGRWGDYSGIVVNPSDEGDTYYVIGEYANNDDTTNDWETWIGSAEFEPELI